MPPAPAADTAWLRRSAWKQRMCRSAIARGKGVLLLALRARMPAALLEALVGESLGRPAPASGNARALPARRQRQARGGGGKAVFVARNRHYTGEDGFHETCCWSARTARPSGKQLLEQRRAPLRPWRRGTPCAWRPHALYGQDIGRTHHPPGSLVGWLASPGDAG